MRLRLFVLAALAAVVLQAPQARAQTHPPKVLWQSFPLVPQPRQRPAAATPRERQASREASPEPELKTSRDPLVVSVLVAIMVSSGVVVLVGFPTRSRVAVVQRRLRSAARLGNDATSRAPSTAHHDPHDLLEALNPNTVLQRGSRGSRVETCEVTLDERDGECELVAVDSSGTRLALSPSFRLPVDGVPDPSAQAALSALVTELERADWALASAGSGWYAVRLERARAKA